MKRLLASACVDEFNKAVAGIVVEAIGRTYPSSIGGGSPVTVVVGHPDTMLIRLTGRRTHGDDFTPLDEKEETHGTSRL